MMSHPNHIEVPLVVVVVVNIVVVVVVVVVMGNVAVVSFPSRIARTSGKRTLNKIYQNLNVAQRLNSQN